MMGRPSRSKVLGNGSAEPFLAFRRTVWWGKRQGPPRSSSSDRGRSSRSRPARARTKPCLTVPIRKGSMMADANGRFMITVVRSDFPNFASNNRMVGTPDENNSVVQGSIAYYGTYTIDEATRVITVKVEGSTFPNFTGGTQTRILSFNGDDEVTYLNPTPSHGGEPAKVTYRRAK